MKRILVFVLILVITFSVFAADFGKKEYFELSAGYSNVTLDLSILGFTSTSKTGGIMIMAHGTSFFGTEEKDKNGVFCNLALASKTVSASTDGVDLDVSNSKWSHILEFNGVSMQFGYAYRTFIRDTTGILQAGLQYESGYSDNTKTTAWAIGVNFDDYISIEQNFNAVVGLSAGIPISAKITEDGNSYKPEISGFLFDIRVGIGYSF